MSDRMSSNDFELMMKQYRLTLAEILYHLPDHPKLLQSYIWHSLDIAPRFPVLKGFLDFWDRELDGKIHSVKIDHTVLIHPSEWRQVKGSFVIH